MLFQSACLEAARRSFVFLHLCYGIYQSAVPATFVRKKTGGTSSEEPLTTPPRSHPTGSIQHRNSVHIILTSELTGGYSGILHFGEMTVSSSGPKIPVAVKLAFSEKEKEVLRHEHNIYTYLGSKDIQGIPKDFGLFVDTELVDEIEGPHALVMSFAGTALNHHQEVDHSAK